MKGLCKENWSMLKNYFTEREGEKLKYKHMEDSSAKR